MNQIQKYAQRKLLSLLSSRWGLLPFVLSTIAIFALGVIVGGFYKLWNPTVDFSDNISGLNLREELAYGPIDAVYTWVNGSDPVWLASKEFYANEYGKRYKHVNNITVSGHGSSNSSNISSSSGSASRYRDSDELRYSLRSLAQYAPWIRRVYLVTDNQIPAWLDLTTSRLILVSHVDIFPNKSHLPVFSSPAIETHLHRIPGLAPRFVYFNDDVFLGGRVRPEDFVSTSGVQRFYPSWEAPRCAIGCTDNWIGDGYCDAACNVEACWYDYPDCINSTSSSSASGGKRQQMQRQRELPCAAGCPDSWLGDKVCDIRCRYADCGFDLGDCGFDQLRHTAMSRSVGLDDVCVSLAPPVQPINRGDDISAMPLFPTVLTVSRDTAALYVNFSNIWSALCSRSEFNFSSTIDNSITVLVQCTKPLNITYTAAEITDHGIVRAVALHAKQHVLVAVLDLHHVTSSLSGDSQADQLVVLPARLNVSIIASVETMRGNTTLIVSFSVVVFNETSVELKLKDELTYPWLRPGPVLGHLHLCRLQNSPVLVSATVLPLIVKLAQLDALAGSVLIRVPAKQALPLELNLSPRHLSNNALLLPASSLYARVVITWTGNGSSPTTSEAETTSDIMLPLIQWGARPVENNGQGVNNFIPVMAEELAKPLSTVLDLLMYLRQPTSARAQRLARESHDPSFSTWVNASRTVDKASVKDLSDLDVVLLIPISESLLAVSRTSWRTGNGSIHNVGAWVHVRANIILKSTNKSSGAKSGTESDSRRSSTESQQIGCLTALLNWKDDAQPQSASVTSSNFNFRRRQLLSGADVKSKVRDHANWSADFLIQLSLLDSIYDILTMIASASSLQHSMSLFLSPIYRYLMKSFQDNRNRLFDLIFQMITSSINLLSTSTPASIDPYNFLNDVRVDTRQLVIRAIIDYSYAVIPLIVNGAEDTHAPHHNYHERNGHSRRLQGEDTYRLSLVQVNRLFTKRYGRDVARKVPAHMPHLIDRAVMAELQADPFFAEHWAATSARRFRAGSDMQPVVMESAVRAMVDTDGDGYLRPTELANLAAIALGRAPTDLELQAVMNCSKYSYIPTDGSTYLNKSKDVGRTVDSDVPLRWHVERAWTAGDRPGPVEETINSFSVTGRLKVQDALNCEIIKTGLRDTFNWNDHSPTHTLGSERAAAFEMLTDNMTHTQFRLDSLRARRPRFFCLNDDMQQPSHDVLQLVKQFYQEMFPQPSPWELPAGVRNPVLRTDQLSDSAKLHLSILSTSTNKTTDKWWDWKLWLKYLLAYLSRLYCLFLQWWAGLKNDLYHSPIQEDLHTWLRRETWITQTPVAHCHWSLGMSVLGLVALLILRELQRRHN